MQRPFKLISPESGMMADETDTVLPVKLKHVLPNTLFSIDLTDSTSYIMRSDGSIIDTQEFREWYSLEQFCQETGYTEESTLDAWRGEVINPDWQPSTSDTGAE